MSRTYDFQIDLDKLMSRFYLQSKFPDFAQALEIGMERGYEELAQRMLEQLLKNLDKFGLSESGIMNEIDFDITDDGILVTLSGADGSYGMFVEYGTGVVGEENPHPMPSRSGWEYDVNEHGDTGWWYPTTESDPNPTKYIDKNGVLKAWTKGQASRPFMYLTWRWATSSGTQIIDKHIKRAFRELERKFK